jgi:hypothetical protein
MDEKRYSIVGSLKVPVDQTGVKRCIAEARLAQLFVRSELSRVAAHIDAIQRFCEHPASEQVTAKDYSGCSSTFCRVCGLDR